MGQAVGLIKLVERVSYRRFKFRILKSYLHPLTDDEIDILSEFLLASSIRAISLISSRVS